MKRDNSPLQAIIIPVLLAVILPLGLGACGESFGDRTLSGAGIGAAAGTVGTVLMGGNPAAGALIGAGVGGAAGALTKEKDVNLGKPIWQ